MKKKNFLVWTILLGIFVVTWYGCETDPEETCEQEVICEEKSVTYCCTEGECVYKFNGKEYTDDQIDELAEDMGCSTAVSILKSGVQVKDYSEIIAKLKALKAKVQEKVNSQHSNNKR